MQHFETELEKAIVLTLFVPLIMSSGGIPVRRPLRSSSGAGGRRIAAEGLVEGRACASLPTGIALGSILGAVGFVRIAIWQLAGFYDYGTH